MLYLPMIRTIDQSMMAEALVRGWIVFKYEQDKIEDEKGRLRSLDATNAHYNKMSMAHEASVKEILNGLDDNQIGGLIRYSELNKFWKPNDES